MINFDDSNGFFKFTPKFKNNLQSETHILWMYSRLEESLFFNKKKFSSKSKKGFSYKHTGDTVLSALQKAIIYKHLKTLFDLQAKEDLFPGVVV